MVFAAIHLRIAVNFLLSPLKVGSSGLIYQLAKDKLRKPRPHDKAWVRAWVSSAIR